MPRTEKRCPLRFRKSADSASFAVGEIGEQGVGHGAVEGQSAKPPAFSHDLQHAHPSSGNSMSSRFRPHNSLTRAGHPRAWASFGSLFSSQPGRRPPHRQPDSGGPLVRSLQRPHPRRRHPGPTGPQCLPHRDEGRVHAQEAITLDRGARLVYTAKAQRRFAPTPPFGNRETAVRFAGKRPFELSETRRKAVIEVCDEHKGAARNRASIDFRRPSLRGPSIQKAAPTYKTARAWKS